MYNSIDIVRLNQTEFSSGGDHLLFEFFRGTKMIGGIVKMVVRRIRAKSEYWVSRELLGTPNLPAAWIISILGGIKFVLTSGTITVLL